MAAQIRVLLVEDSVADAELVRRELEGSLRTFEVVHVHRLAEAVAALQRNGMDAVLLDLSLPDADGLTALARLRTASPHVPIVVLTGLDDEDVAIKAVQGGAQDYLVKGHFDRHLLVRALCYAIERARAERERELFLGAIGHDLRNPLSAISVAAATLLRASDLPPDISRPVGKIATGAQRMTRLIEQLLDFARSRVGPLTVARQPARLVDICRTVIDEVETAFPGVAVELEVEDECQGGWDPDRLTQVVQNLVTNALQHGSPAATVRVTVRRQNDEAILEVHNQNPQGRPIPEETMKHLFDPFRRASQPGRGLGLGLYIAQHVVAAHDGEIGARSDAGGTTLTVRLPCGVAARAAAGAQ